MNNAFDVDQRLLLYPNVPGMQLCVSWHAVGPSFFLRATEQQQRVMCVFFFNLVEGSIGNFLAHTCCGSYCCYCYCRCYCSRGDSI